MRQEAQQRKHRHVTARFRAEDPPRGAAETAESSDGKKDDDDDRSAVIEGIARVIASMPDPIAAADFAKRLPRPSRLGRGNT